MIRKFDLCDVHGAVKLRRQPTTVAHVGGAAKLPLSARLEKLKSKPNLHLLPIALFSQDFDVRVAAAGKRQYVRFVGRGGGRASERQRLAPAARRRARGAEGAASHGHERGRPPPTGRPVGQPGPRPAAARPRQPARRAQPQDRPQRPARGRAPAVTGSRCHAHARGSGRGRRLRQLTRQGGA
jgi:hypothetical protein